VDQTEQFWMNITSTGHLNVAGMMINAIMRWLTVGVPGDGSREILLELPGPPAMSEGDAAQVREMVAKGATGGWIGVSTDDCRKTYESLLAAGVDVTEEPQERPYGLDCAVRDPFGNKIRISQMNPIAAPQP